MITREMFLEALKMMKDASEVIEAYQMQFSDTEKPKSEYKPNHLIQVGDFIECVEVHGNSVNNLTKGKKYEVLRTREGISDDYFSLKTDKGQLREYNVKNSQFKSLK